jgi:uncharacterized coiled-coil protein SlyX
MNSSKQLVFQIIYERDCKIETLEHKIAALEDKIGDLEDRADIKIAGIQEDNERMLQALKKLTGIIVARQESSDSEESEEDGSEDGAV